MFKVKIVRESMYNILVSAFLYLHVQGYLALNLGSVEFCSLQGSMNTRPEKLQKQNPAGPGTGSCKLPISTTPNLNEQRLHW
jgi:hypothetical protein